MIVPVKDAAEAKLVNENMKSQFTGEEKQGKTLLLTKSRALENEKADQTQYIPHTQEDKGSWIILPFVPFNANQDDPIDQEPLDIQIKEIEHIFWAKGDDRNKVLDGKGMDQGSMGEAPSESHPGLGQDVQTPRQVVETAWKSQ